MTTGRLNIGGFVDEDNDLGMRNHPGYFGAFTTRQAEGALPNGTRIRKSWSEPGDTTPVGTEGVVLGSLPCPNKLPDKPDLPESGGFFYFVEWDNRPKTAIGMVARKIERVDA